LKLAIKWAVSIAIGLFFVWLGVPLLAPRTRSSPTASASKAPHLIAGDVSPAAVEWHAWYRSGQTSATAGPKLFSSRREGRFRPPGWTFDLLYLIPYFAVLVIIHYLRVLRWYPLLAPIAKVPFAQAQRRSAPSVS
jgi:hypothetical protein